MLLKALLGFFAFFSRQTGFFAYNLQVYTPKCFSAYGLSQTITTRHVTLRFIVIPFPRVLSADVRCMSVCSHAERQQQLSLRLYPMLVRLKLRFILKMSLVLQSKFLLALGQTKGGKADSAVFLPLLQYVLSDRMVIQLEKWFVHKR